jgi:hypothetical protein
MAQEITATIESFRQNIAGSLITPQDPEYDQPAESGTLTLIAARQQSCNARRRKTWPPR